MIQKLFIHFVWCRPFNQLNYMCIEILYEDAYSFIVN